MAEHVIVLPGTEGPEITIRTRAVGFPDVFVAGREIEEISLRGRPAWPAPTMTASKRIVQSSETMAAAPATATRSSMIAAGRSLGFRLARFRNSTGYVTEEQLLNIARARTA